MTLKLFAIYIGGEHPRANIEVHDIRFILAPSIDETHAQLRSQWWGRPSSLHIDCWAEIDRADGHRISLKTEPATHAEKLFYVNLGGYDGSDTERHKNVFVVADTVAHAKSRAIKMAKGWDAPHRDDMYEAEQAFALDDAASAQQLYIHLTPSSDVSDPVFTCDYLPIRAR